MMNIPCDTNNVCFEISNGLYCGFNDDEVVTKNERNSRTSFDTADSSRTKAKKCVSTVPIPY